MADENKPQAESPSGSGTSSGKVLSSEGATVKVTTISLGDRAQREIARALKMGVHRRNERAC